MLGPLTHGGPYANMPPATLVFFNDNSWRSRLARRKPAPKHMRSFDIGRDQHTKNENNRTPPTTKYSGLRVDLKQTNRVAVNVFA